MKVNLVVIFGGKSVEHEISVISALQAISAIDKKKYIITPIYITKEGKWYSGSELLNINIYKNIKKLIKTCSEVFISPDADDSFLYIKSFWKRKPIAKLDVVIPVLHGANGEDGSIQGMFELKNIPYVGSDVLGSSICMDKIIAKMILNDAMLPIVNYIWFTDKQWHENNKYIIKEIEAIGFPVIVKPSNLGSSVGISKANNIEELHSSVELAGSFSGRILVEEMIVDLKEINCSVMGDSDIQETSVCEEPIKNGDILSYKDKYLTNESSSKGMSSTKREIPAKLSNEQAEKIMEIAKKTFRVLCISGVARIDFLIDKNRNKIYINEINTIPGSLSFYLWEATGISFSILMEKLIGISLKRHREKNNYIHSYNNNIFSVNTNSIKLGKK